MPKWEVELEDGRILELESDAKPSDEAINQIVAGLPRLEKSVGSITNEWKASAPVEVGPPNAAFPSGEPKAQTPLSNEQKAMEDTWKGLSGFEKFFASDFPQLAKGAIETVGATVKGAGIQSELNPPELLADPEFGTGRGLEQFSEQIRQSREAETPEQRGQRIATNPLVKAGEAIQEYSEATFPTIQPQSVERPIGDILQGAGSSAGFAASGLLGPAGIAASGYFSSGASAYDEAIQNGATQAQAEKAFFINAIAGTSEALPIVHIFERINKMAGGTLSGALKEMVASGFEEGAQEAFQAIVGNASAKYLYDDERKLLQDVAKNAGVGGAVGFLLSAFGIGGAGALRRARGGERNARKDTQAAKVHGDVRPQPQQGPGQVPIQEGGKGVQPLAETPAKEISLDEAQVAAANEPLLNANQDLQTKELWNSVPKEIRAQMSGGREDLTDVSWEDLTPGERYLIAARTGVVAPTAEEVQGEPLNLVEANMRIAKVKGPRWMVEPKVDALGNTVGYRVRVRAPRAITPMKTKKVARKQQLKRRLRSETPQAIRGEGNTIEEALNNAKVDLELETWTDRRRESQPITMTQSQKEELDALRNQQTQMSTTGLEMSDDGKQRLLQLTNLEAIVERTSDPNLAKPGPQRVPVSAEQAELVKLLTADEIGMLTDPKDRGRMEELLNKFEARALTALEEGAYIFAERAALEEDTKLNSGKNTGIEVISKEQLTNPDLPFAATLAPYTVFTVNRQTGNVVAVAGNLQEWINEMRYGKQFSDEKIHRAIKSAIAEELIHLGVHDTTALNYWNGLTAFEKWVIKNRYLMGQKMNLSDTQLGHEALRFRIQQALKLTPTEFSQMAIGDRISWGALSTLERIIRAIRENFSTMGKTQVALFDQALSNLTNVKAMYVAAGLGPVSAPRQKIRLKTADGKIIEAEWAGYYDMRKFRQKRVFPNIGRMLEEGQPWDPKEVTHGPLREGEVILDPIPSFDEWIREISGSDPVAPKVSLAAPRGQISKAAAKRMETLRKYIESMADKPVDYEEQQLLRMKKEQEEQLARQMEAMKPDNAKAFLSEYLSTRGNISIEDFSEKFRDKFGVGPKSFDPTRGISDDAIQQLMKDNWYEVLQKLPGSEIRRIIIKRGLSKLVVGGGRGLGEIADPTGSNVNTEEVSKQVEFLGHVQAAVARAKDAKEKEAEFTKLVNEAREVHKELNAAGWMQADEKGFAKNRIENRPDIKPVPKPVADEIAKRLKWKRDELARWTDEAFGEDASEQKVRRELHWSRVPGGKPGVTYIEESVRKLTGPESIPSMFEAEAPPRTEGGREAPKRARAEAVITEDIWGDFQDFQQRMQRADDEPIAPEDLADQKSSEGRTFFDIADRDLRNPNLGKILTQDARRYGYGSTASKRLLVMVDRKTGKVQISSIYPTGKKDVGVGPDKFVARVRNPGVTSTGVPLEDIMKNYRPIYSILLKDPVQDFNQEYESVSEFENKVGQNLRNATSRDLYDIYPEWYAKHIIEGQSTEEEDALAEAQAESEIQTKATSREGGLVGPMAGGTRMQMGISPGILESNAPITDNEASAMIQYIMDNAGGIESLEDVGLAVSDLRIQPGKKFGFRNVRATSAILKALRQIMNADERLSPEEAVHEFSQRIYDYSKRAKSSDELIRTVLEGFNRSFPKERESTNTPEQQAAIADFRAAEARVAHTAVERAKWFDSRRLEALNEWLRTNSPMSPSDFVTKWTKEKGQPPPVTTEPEATAQSVSREISMPAPGETIKKEIPGVRGAVRARTRIAGVGRGLFEARQAADQAKAQLADARAGWNAEQLAYELRNAGPESGVFERAIQTLGRLIEAANAEADYEMALKTMADAFPEFSKQGFKEFTQKKTVMPEEIANNLFGESGPEIAQLILEESGLDRQIELPRSWQEKLRAARRAQGVQEAPKMEQGSLTLPATESPATGQPAPEETTPEPPVKRTQGELPMAPRAVLNTKAKKALDSLKKMRQEADDIEAELVNKAFINPLATFTEWYSGWLTDNLRRQGGEVAAEAADLGNGHAARTKILYAGWATEGGGDIAKALAGGTRMIAGIQVPSPELIRVTQWLNSLQVTPSGKAARARVVDAMESKIEVPDFVFDTINAARRANRYTGDMIASVIEEFQATGKFERMMNEYGYDIRMAGEHNPLFEQLLDEEARANTEGEPHRYWVVKKLMRDHWDKWRNNMLSPAPDVNIIEKINQDYVRQWPNVITHLKVGGIWQPVMHTNLYSYLENTARRASAVKAFREIFPKTREGRDKFNEIDGLIRNELRTNGVRDWNALVKAMQGRPVDTFNHLDKAWSNQAMRPSEFWPQVAKGLNDTFLSLMRRTVLTGQMVTQLPETLIAPMIYFSPKTYWHTIKNFKDLYGQMERNGQINKLMYDWSWDPANPARSAFRQTGNVLAVLSGQNFLNEFQGKWFAALATTAANRLANDEMTDLEIRDFKNTARHMGYTWAQAEQMALGDPSLLEEFKLRLPTWAVGENKLASEGSRLSSNRLFNSIFRFQLYPMTKLNQIAGALRATADIQRRGDTMDKILAYSKLARVIFGTTGQGMLLTLVASLVYDGPEGYKQKVNQFFDEPVDFLMESLLGAMSGPGYLLWRTAQFAGIGGLGEQIGRMAFPFGVFQELSEAMFQYGRYSNRTFDDAISLYFARKTPGYRIVKSALAVSGLARDNLALNADIKAVQEWKMKRWGISRHLQQAGEVDEGKQFRIWMKRAEEAVRNGDSEEFIKAKIRAVLNAPTDVPFDTVQASEMANQSLKRRKILTGPSGQELKLEEMNSLMQRIGFEAYMRVKGHDEMLEALANGDPL